MQIDCWRWDLQLFVLIGWRLLNGWFVFTWVEYLSLNSKQIYIDWNTWENADGIVNSKSICNDPKTIFITQKIFIQNCIQISITISIQAFRDFHTVFLTYFHTYSHINYCSEINKNFCTDIHTNLCRNFHTNFRQIFIHIFLQIFIQIFIHIFILY